MNFPKPLPGLINCVSCHALNVKGCFECRRCKVECGCICKECLNCTPTTLSSNGHRRPDERQLVFHHPKYFCTVCRLCRRHNSDGLTQYQCTCRQRPSKGRDPAPISTMDFNPLSRTLGLEIEVSYLGATRLQVPEFVKYQWEHDGSITAGGQELVLGRLVGDNFLRGITALAGEFERYGFQADQSCGLHVHVGVDDWGAFELRRLVLLYRKFEPLFYNLVAKGRDGWREVRGERKYYAKRWEWPKTWYQEFARQQEPSRIRRMLVEALYRRSIAPHVGRDGSHTKIRYKVEANEGKPFSPWPQKPEHIVHGYSNMRNIAAHKYEACRYYGLNLHTFFQRNTVEYRHHEGTVALDKLLYWPLWCGWFTELASILTDAEVERLGDWTALVNGEWCRPGRVITLPQPVRDWVGRTLKERGHVG